MLFNSPAFLFQFLPLVLAVHVLLHRWRLGRAARVWLLLASLGFYASWHADDLPLLLGSIAFNFWVGGALQPGRLAPRPRRVLMLTAVALNLGLLVWYKYAAFFAATAGALTGLPLKLQPGPLPLGISFFTFTQLTWLADRWRGEAGEPDPVDYALFVTYFPHLVAGPILHHREMMSQFASRWTRALRHRHVMQGLFLLSVGLFKKVVLADLLAPWATAAFDGSGPLDMAQAWTGSLAYTCQLYFDFSGYCDMAMGISLLFNIRLPLNFDSPYQATDIQAFWRRWHITLGRLLRDYLYQPLGGNRHGLPRECLNLGLTFLVGGLWHGAGWTFLAWGALHGGALIVHRLWRQTGRRLAMPLAWALTFLCVHLGWVFFRSRTLPEAGRMLRALVDVDSLLQPAQQLPTAHLAWLGAWVDALPAWLPASVAAQAPALALLLLGALVLRGPGAMHLMQAHALRLRGALASALLAVLSVLVLLSSRSTVFLYFNF